MVIRLEPAVFASYLGTFNGVCKLSSLCVFKHWLQLSCEPILLAILVYMFYVVKGLCIVFYNFNHIKLPRVSKLDTLVLFCFKRTAEYFKHLLVLLIGDNTEIRKFIKVPFSLPCGFVCVNVF